MWTMWTLPFPLPPNYHLIFGPILHPALGYVSYSTWQPDPRGDLSLTSWDISDQYRYSNINQSKPNSFKKKCLTKIQGQKKTISISNPQNLLKGQVHVLFFHHETVQRQQPSPQCSTPLDHHRPQACTGHHGWWLLQKSGDHHLDALGI